jgi:hypothetical protein
MAVTTKPKTYESHGREFATLQAAERHDALYVAREKLEDAQRAFQSALAEDAVTADGHAFEFGVFRDYYRIVVPYWSMPHIEKTSYLCWSWAVRETVDAREVVEIREERGGGKTTDWVPIRELYADPKKALAALDAARRKWLADVGRQIEEDAKRERRL